MKKSAETEFDMLVNLGLEKQAGQGRFRPLVAREILLFDILFALHKGGYLRQGIVFQGGTLLRFCYGNSRYSVDLDFCGGKDFSPVKFAGVKECIIGHVKARYGLEVFVKEPKNIGRPSLTGSDRVYTWVISMDTAPARPDIPRLRVKLQIAGVPAYSKEPLTLMPIYPFLPDGYTEYFVLSESMDEVMADKLIALPTALPFVRYRDIWDIQWMARKGVSAMPELVRRKIEDYQETDYQQKLDKLLAQIAVLATSNDFKDEMNRLLPEDIYESMIGSELAANYQSTFMSKFLEGFKSKM